MHVVNWLFTYLKYKIIYAYKDKYNNVIKQLKSDKIIWPYTHMDNNNGTTRL